MDDLSRLPSRRTSLKGTDLDGNTVILATSVARKLYRCPACGGEIAVGSEHVLVRTIEPGGDSYHQHWHRDCTGSLLRGMRGTHPRPAADVSPPRPPRPARRKGKK